MLKTLSKQDLFQDKIQKRLEQKHQEEMAQKMKTLSTHKSSRKKLKSKHNKSSIQQELTQESIAPKLDIGKLFANMLDKANKNQPAQPLSESVTPASKVAVPIIPNLDMLSALKPTVNMFSERRASEKSKAEVVAPPLPVEDYADSFTLNIKNKGMVQISIDAGSGSDNKTATASVFNSPYAGDRTDNLDEPAAAKGPSDEDKA